ncbi:MULTISPECIES: hypothetical protein [Streptomyces]|uniref:hypothetical protein n=1 Tax=Streptomyces lycopersici TaxID=2974589 RepID=UPI0021D0BA17|nr:hypothetical protein [Streptomyces sp. NEAU-383]
MVVKKFATGGFLGGDPLWYLFHPSATRWSPPSKARRLRLPESCSRSRQPPCGYVAVPSFAQAVIRVPEPWRDDFSGAAVAASRESSNRLANIEKFWNSVM